LTISDGYLRKVFPAGTEIFRSGDLGNCAYIIDEGEGEIGIPLNAHQTIHNRLGPGELFGEMALIDDHKRIGSARALSDTVMRVITSNQILDRLHHSDEVIAFILRITLMRYRHLLQQMRRAEDSTTEVNPAKDELAMPDSRDAVAKLELENELREGLDKGELRLHFQPLVALSDQRLAGFEALLRWEKPGSGLMPPGVFIPLAEETGLIVLICRWVLGEAAGFLARFQEASGRTALGDDRLTVSVNVTKDQIDDSETMQILDRMASEHGITPEQIKLELTEGVLMNDYARTRGWISDLKRRRIKISIDDFGTGYSSLGYLHQFEVDEVKIDRSFVIEMLTQPRGMEIVRAVIGLARGLGLKTVAEGIENQEQAMVLRAAGCDYGQGYYFARPLAEAEILPRLQAGTLGFRA
jgi:EAL domain-containing protein (putative c-di-GMP-specific phosphodiesterase class I)/CRP-like cAMP-binding protein